MTVAGFRVSTLRCVERLRGGACPRSYRGTRPRFASGTLMSLRTAPTPRRAPHQPPSSRLNRDSPPPPQFARHGAHTKPRAHLPQPRRERSTPRIPMHAEVHISSTTAPGNQARKDGIARSDIRVSEAKRGRVPCRNEGEYRLPSSRIRSKEDNMHLALQNRISRGTKKSRRFRRISGIFFEVRPLGLEPRTH